MTSQHPFGRYMVVSHDRYEKQFPNLVPAGRYAQLDAAIEHAESVTYKMVVIDAEAESRGFAYTNWGDAPTSSPWGKPQESKCLGAGIWSVSTAGHGGIWLSDRRLADLTKILGYEYRTFCGSPRWFEEDCDWCIPVIAFQIKGKYEAACKQLRGMSQWIDNAKYKQAYDALVAAGRIMDVEKVKQAMKRPSPFPAHCLRGNSYDFSPSDADPGL